MSDLALPHGLSSTDHDDACVDANPTAGWQEVQRRRGLRLTRGRGVPLAGEAQGVGELGGGHLACNDVANLTAGVQPPAQVRFDDYGVAGPLHCHPALTRRAPACCSSWFQ